MGANLSSSFVSVSFATSFGLVGFGYDPLFVCQSLHTWRQDVNL